MRKRVATDCQLADGQPRAGESLGPIAMPQDKVYDQLFSPQALFLRLNKLFCFERAPSVIKLLCFLHDSSLDGAIENLFSRLLLSLQRRGKAVVRRKFHCFF